MRLTKEIREDIISKVIAKSIPEEVELLKKELEIVAQEVADNYYPKKVQEWLDAAPEGGVGSTSSVFLRFSKNENRISHKLFNPRGGYFADKINLSRSLKKLAVDIDNENIEVPKNRVKIVKKILAKLDALVEKKKDIKQTLAGALWSCNTFKQLKDNYPELAEYLPKIEGTGTALAVTNSEVVRVLGGAK